MGLVSDPVVGCVYFPASTVCHYDHHVGFCFATWGFTAARCTRLYRPTTAHALACPCAQPVREGMRRIKKISRRFPLSCEHTRAPATGGFEKRTNLLAGSCRISLVRAWGRMSKYMRLVGGELPHACISLYTVQAVAKALSLFLHTRPMDYRHIDRKLIHQDHDDSTFLSPKLTCSRA